MAGPGGARGGRVGGASTSTRPRRRWGCSRIRPAPSEPSATGSATSRVARDQDALAGQETPLRGGFVVAETPGRSDIAEAAGGARAHRARLASLRDRRIGQLAVRQRAQVALVPALSQRPDLLIRDDPVARRDPPARREVR